MNRWLHAAWSCSTAGVVFALVCLIKTTPITMTVFFMLGLPCFAAGIVIYLALVVRALKAQLMGEKQPQ